MNDTTKSTIEIAKTLAKRGFALASIEINTPDGRHWSIAPVPAGRGRHADGHWGPIAGSLGGFRLFEMDLDRGTIDEHDAVEDDTWNAADLMDYLEAVGQPNPRIANARTPEPIA